MKITKRQLRRIIKEEKAKLISERSSGNPALHAEEQSLIRATVAFADRYMLLMGMNPADLSDAKGTRRMVDDIINSVLGETLK
mgnify:CR=1 FL=1